MAFKPVPMSTEPSTNKMKKTEPIQETGTCYLCGEPYEHWGNNPEPIAKFDQRCCDKCNHEKVIPSRMYPVKLPYSFAAAILGALVSAKDPLNAPLIEMLCKAMSANYGALGRYEEHKTQMAEAMAKLDELREAQEK